MNLTQGLHTALESIIIPPRISRRGWVVEGAANTKVNETEMTGPQRMLVALEGIAATSEHLVKLCDDFIAGQPEREKAYLDLVELVSPKPKRVALRPEDKKALDDLLNKKLREIRREPS